MSEIWTMGEILVEIMRPEAGMQLHEKGEFIGPLPSGAPAIFIDTAARLGHTSGIIGGVGKDGFGRCVLERLERDGVNCSHVVSVENMSTAVAFVTYYDDGSREFIFHIDSTPAVMAKSPVIEDIPVAGFFHVMGCSLMSNPQFCTEIIETMGKFIEKGAKISFDTNIRPELLAGRDINELVGPVMKNCSVLLPGVDELRFLTGENDIDRAVENLFKNENLEVVALKKGKAGCTIFSRQDNFSMGVYPVTPVDPTGAGDCFDAGFLCSLLENRSLKECAKIATAAASLNTAAFGPMEGDISVDTVRNMMSTHSLP